MHQWSFKNNGIVFRDEDWSRLKKIGESSCRSLRCLHTLIPDIAEGNPDEEKIGAFGVGFYSLFSVTEEPWVFSGGRVDLCLPFIDNPDAQCRSMDEFLLEGQEGPAVCSPRCPKGRH